MRGNKLVGAQIGCGAFANAQHLPNMASMDDICIKYCCDPNLKSAQNAAARFGGEQAVSDYSQIIQDSELDFLTVATPHDMHLPIVRAAAANGKHVFCEKPMALSIEESNEIIRAVKHGGIKLCVDLNRRMAPSMLALKKRYLEQLANPKHNSWRYIETDREELPEEKTSHFLIRIQDESSSYRMIHLDPAHGGGCIIGESVHWLDLACWLFAPAKPIEITAWGNVRMNHGIFLKFDNGNSATLDFSSCGTFDYPKELFEITSRAALFRNLFFVENRYYGIPGLDSETFPLQADDFKDSVPQEGFDAFMAKNLAKNQNAGGNIRNDTRQLVVDKGHRNMMQGFFNAIRNNTQTPCDEYCGLQATLLAQLAIQSIKCKSTLPVLEEELHPAIL